MSNIGDRFEKKRQELTTSAAPPADNIKAVLERYRPNLEAALPRHMPVAQFISTVHGAVSKNPDIAKCDPLSVLQAVGRAARMGLSIDTVGHGFLVPYNDRRNNRVICEFIPGWQGIVDLINRSGRGVVDSGAVFDGDVFDYDLGTNRFVRHRNEGAETADKLLYVYALGWIRGEGGWTPPPIIQVWKAERVGMHLSTYNKVGDKHYALQNGNNWIQYARKLPLLQVCKFMPKSAEVSKAIEAANRADTGEPMTLEGDFVFPEGETGGGQGTSGGGAGNSNAGGGASTEPGFDEIKKRLEAAKSRDGADLILDGARHLPAEPLKELAAIADKKFPRS